MLYCAAATRPQPQVHCAGKPQLLGVMMYLTTIKVSRGGGGRPNVEWVERRRLVGCTTVFQFIRLLITISATEGSSSDSSRDNLSSNWPSCTPSPFRSRPAREGWSIFFPIKISFRNHYPITHPSRSFRLLSLRIIIDGQQQHHQRPSIDRLF